MRKFLGLLIELHPEAESSFPSSGASQSLSSPVSSSNQQPLAKKCPLLSRQTASMLPEPQVSNTGFGSRPGERAGNTLVASLEDPSPTMTHTKRRFPSCWCPLVLLTIRCHLIDMEHGRKMHENHLTFSQRGSHSKQQQQTACPGIDLLPLTSFDVCVQPPEELVRRAQS